MQTLLDNPALKLYALVASLAAVHLILIALWTGTVRAMRKVFVNPEDATLNKGQQADLEHPDTARVKRAHQNALENAVPFFAIGLLYALTGPSATMAQVFFFTFLAARVLHTFFYLSGKQPFRTMMFAIGVLSMLGMAVQTLRAVV
jgi:glutathione S-transferase